jgi:hypothetical protein
MIGYLKSVAIATVVDVADILAEAFDAGAILLRGLGNELAQSHPDYSEDDVRRIRAERFDKLDRIAKEREGLAYSVVAPETLAGYFDETRTALGEQWAKAWG